MGSAGHKRDTDPDHIREFRVKVSDLGEADIADLIGVNLIRDPQGQPCRAYHAVVRMVGTTELESKDQNLIFLFRILLIIWITSPIIMVIIRDRP